MGARENIVKLLMGKLGGAWEGGIRAYHSSPYDFDKFDWSKLRTGEGANVYGAGFYAAENPAVSGQGGQYWKQFLDRFPTAEQNAAATLEGHGFDRAAAIDMSQSNLDRLRDRIANIGKTSRNFASPTEERAWLDGQLHRAEVQHELLTRGPVGPRTYEVNINARPELMLDWDKPIRQQDSAINALAAKVGMDPRDNDVVKGAALYRRAGDYFGPKQATSDFDVAASRGMADYGIPGIRYLDQGSRDLLRWEKDIQQARFDAERVAREHGDPYEVGLIKDHLAALEQSKPAATYNYVVTDPSKLDILAKYGLVGTAGGGMGALAAQDQYGAEAQQ